MRFILSLAFIFSLTQVSYGIVGLNVTSISKTVASTATPESLTAAKVLTPQVIIQAKCTNTQAVFIGSSTSQDIQLAPCATLSLEDPVFNKNDYDFNLKNIYIDVSVNGEGVNALYIPGPLN